jgi:hypothetical protein
MRQFAANKTGFSVLAVLVVSSIVMIFVAAIVQRIQTGSMAGKRLMNTELTRLFKSRFETLLVDPTWCTEMRIDGPKLKSLRLNEVDLGEEFEVTKVTLNDQLVIAASDATLIGQKLWMKMTKLNSRSRLAQFKIGDGSQALAQFTVLNKSETLVCARAESSLVVASARRSGFAIDMALCSATEVVENNSLAWPAATAYQCGNKGYCKDGEFGRYDPNRPNMVPKVGRNIPRAAFEGMTSVQTLRSNWSNLVADGAIRADSLQVYPTVGGLGRGYDGATAVAAGSGPFCKPVSGGSIKDDTDKFCWDAFWTASIPFGNTTPVRQKHPASIPGDPLYHEWTQYFPKRNDDTAPTMDPRDTKINITHDAPQLRQLEGRCWIQGLEVPASEPSMDGIFHVNQQRDYSIGNPNPVLTENDKVDAITFAWGLNAVGCRQDKGYMLLGCTYSAQGRKSTHVYANPDKDLDIGTSDVGLGNFCFTDDIVNPHYSAWNTTAGHESYPEPYVVSKVSVTAVCGKIPD